MSENHKWKTETCGGCDFWIEGECREKAAVADHPRNRVHGHFPSRESKDHACSEFRKEKVE